MSATRTEARTFDRGAAGTPHPPHTPLISSRGVLLTCVCALPHAQVHGGGAWLFVAAFLALLGGRSGTIRGLHLRYSASALVQRRFRGYRALVQRRNAYREGKKGVQVWLSLALYGQVRANAERTGTSMQDWLTEAIREKVTGDAAGDDRPRAGRPAAADGSRPLDYAGGGGDAAPRERDRDGGQPLVGAQNVSMFADESYEARSIFG